MTPFTSRSSAVDWSYPTSEAPFLSREWKEGRLSRPERPINPFPAATDAGLDEDDDIWTFGELMQDVAGTFLNNDEALNSNISYRVIGWMGNVDQTTLSSETTGSRMNYQKLIFFSSLVSLQLTSEAVAHLSEIP